MGAPSLCYPDCSKAGGNDSLALKFHKCPREDSDWASPEPIIVNHSDCSHVLPWDNPTWNILIIAEWGKDDLQRIRAEEPKPMSYLKPHLQLELTTQKKPTKNNAVLKKKKKRTHRIFRGQSPGQGSGIRSSNPSSPLNHCVTLGWSPPLFDLLERHSVKWHSGGTGYAGCSERGQREGKGTDIWRCWVTLPILWILVKRRKQPVLQGHAIQNWSCHFPPSARCLSSVPGTQRSLGGVWCSEDNSPPCHGDKGQSEKALTRGT